LQRTAGNQAALRFLGSRGDAPANRNETLTVNEPEDAYEREADRAADRVMRMETSTIEHAQGGSRIQRLVQRKCAQCTDEEEGQKRLRLSPAEGITQRKVSQCKEEEEQRQKLIKRTETGAGPPVAPPSVHDVLSSPGRPLNSTTRAFMEPRFGYDFSKVRLHTDGKARESARAIHARAYTVGKHVVLGRVENASGQESQRLIAHELAHVVQNDHSSSSAMVQRDVDNSPNLTPLQLHLPRLGESVRWHQRRPLRLGPDLSASLLPGPAGELDLNLVDQELAAGAPLTKIQGAIGHGSRFCKGQWGTRLCPDSPAEEDPWLPIEALVFPRTPPAAAASGSGQPSGQGGVSTPSPFPAPAPRALVVGGIHGNEGGAPQHVLIAEQLRSELDQGLQRDFDTILIPVMNPGGLADNERLNRHGVDLNRNFPGLPGFPAGTAVVEQPEVTSVRRAIQILRPSRILVLHAHSDPTKGGVYADPVEGEARELACRMALRMRGTPAGSAVVPGNRLTAGVCESRYPDTAAVQVSTTQSSLGAWGSASTSVGGGGATVITHEIPDLASRLPLQGRGRTVESMMPGIRDFLLDNRRSPSEADDFLRRAVTSTFLSGQDTPADLGLRNTIQAIVTRRFQDMNAFYIGVWRPSRPASEQSSLPPGLSIVTGTGVRDFARQADIVTGELQGKLTGTSVDSDIEREILRVMETRSLPGFSRHHWGTDIDIVSATRGDWDPATGRFRALIPFLQEHAFRFGFFHPYTAGYTRSGGQPAQAGFPSPAAHHYLEEPWHLSHWPLANVLQQLWIQTFSGPVFDNLVLQTAHAIHGRVPEAIMTRVLRGIGLSSFQSNVAPAPQ